ncbi:hypothetical protein JTB14_036184 [Gonioctena quinquepunctata]|nr:hypothetical protein JTB14_036184 [Gonioctena quinquepunctata]
MLNPHDCVAFIPDVRGKMSSPESVLNRLRRANRGLLLQEWKILRCEESGPGHTWILSMEASVKALEKLDFKSYFSFGRVQFRLKASKAEGSEKPTTRPKPWDERGQFRFGVLGLGLNLLVVEPQRSRTKGISILPKRRVHSRQEELQDRRRLRGAVDSLQARGRQDPTRAEGQEALVCDLGAERPAPDRKAESPKGPGAWGVPGGGRRAGVLPSEFNWRGAPGGDRLVRGLERPPQGRGMEDPALAQAAGKARWVKPSSLYRRIFNNAKAASYTISRRFANELLDMALIQEPWTTGPARINGLGNIPGKLTTFSFLLRRRGGNTINNPNGGEQLERTVCSAYFAGDIGAENPPTLVKNLVRHCRRNNMQLIVG